MSIFKSDPRPFFYARKNIDFMDAYNAVFMKYQGLREIYSYDEDFEMIEDIEGKEP
jgi:predicted nucleic acid-binding protein